MEANLHIESFSNISCST
jgi:hypothetical protein